MEKYTPDRLDLIWLKMDPQAGREQSGRRPALVISPLEYNCKIGLAIVCPVTSRIKGYPFEVSFAGDRIEGAVLADHIKSVDWRARGARFIERAPARLLRDVLERIAPLISA